MFDRLAGSRVRRLLFEDDARGVRNVTVALIGSSVVFTVLINVAFAQRTVLTPVVGSLWWGPGTLLLVALAAVTAARFGGLAHCWAVAFGPPFGGAANLLIIGMGMGGTSGPLEVLGMGLVAGLTGAIVLGTPGYLIGSVVRRTK